MNKFSKEYFLSLQSSWEFLKSTNLPVFIYGMGDGALKILKVFDEYKIACSGFFASDEFVRGHFFEGHKVHKLSEIEECVDEFVIVLAFACGYESLLARVQDIAKKHILIAPDVPVIGGGLFTKDYFCDNFSKIEQVYSILADDISKQVYINTIAYKITGNIDFICDISTTPNEAYNNIIRPGIEEVFLDLGAYNGDTVLEFIEHTKGCYKQIIALEPDKRNFRKLNENTIGLSNITSMNVAGWIKDETLIFSNSTGRQSMIAKKGVEISARSVDSILNGKKATFIKYDVEGAENEAIRGSINTIESFKPKIKVALYHRNEDIFSLPLLVNEINSDYKLYIRKFPYIPAWEVNMFCI